MKRMIVLGFMAIMLCAVTACQQTPADAYEEPSNVERLFTTAAQLEASEIAAPDYELPDGNYVWNFSSEDGNLTVSASVSVTVQEAPLFMVHVSGDGFTQTQVTGIFNYLFEGQKVTTTIGENVQTKAEIQAQLEKMNQALADGTFTKYGFTKAEYEEAIRQQEAAYDDAPNASTGERVATDGTMLTIRDDTEGDYQALSALNDANDTLVVRSAPSDNRSQLPSSCRYDRYDAPEYSMLDAVALQINSALPQAAEGKLTRSYDDAKSLSDGLFASAGVDVSLLAAYVVSDRQAGNTDGIVSEASHYAYEFQYTRTIDGVPIAADVWTDDNSTDGFPWDQELIKVIVDDAGIAQFHWSEPISLQEGTTDCASILTFPQAQEIFEKMVPLIYGSQTTSANPNLDRVKINIDLDQVQLCLLRVKELTAESKSGLLVPAWVFYGDIVSQTFWKDGTSYDPLYRQGMNGASGCDYSPGPTIIFAINAIDGSVIDTSQGY